MPHTSQHSNSSNSIAYFTALNFNQLLKSNFGFFRIIPILTANNDSVDVFISNEDWSCLITELKRKDKNKLLKDFSLSSEPGIILWKDIKIYHYLRSFILDKKNNYKLALHQYENSPSSKFIDEAVNHWPGIIMTFDEKINSFNEIEFSGESSALKNMFPSKEEKSDVKDFQERGWPMDIFSAFSSSSNSSNNSASFPKNCHVENLSRNSFSTSSKNNLNFPYFALSSEHIESKDKFFRKKFKIDKSETLIGVQLDSYFIFSSFFDNLISHFKEQIKKKKNVKFIFLNDSNDSDLNKTLFNKLNQSNLDINKFIFLGSNLDIESNSKFYTNLVYHLLEDAVASLDLFYSLTINDTNELSLPQMFALEQNVPQLTSSSILCETYPFLLKLHYDHTFDDSLNELFNLYSAPGENTINYQELNRNYLLEVSNFNNFKLELSELFNEPLLIEKLLESRSLINLEFENLKQSI